MKILSLHIENFGKLSGYDQVFTDGLNTICSENGWGKTTLANFIRAMFYGMDKKGNLKPYVAERSKYLPWQGGIYGGSLIFETKGKTYRVLRTFGTTPEGDYFELVDVKTGKQSRDFSSNLGEELFGVGKETLTLTTYFPQGMLEGEINDEVRSHLTGASQFAGDMEMQSKAVKKLKSLSREIMLASPKAHEISACENEIEDGKLKLISLQDEKAQLKDSCERLRSEKVGESSLQTSTKQIASLSEQLVDINEQDAKLKEERDKHKTRLKSKSMLAFIVPGIIAVLCLVGAIIGVVVANVKNVAILCGVFAAAALMIGSGIIIGASLTNRVYRKSKARQAEIDKQIAKLDARRQKIQVEIAELTTQDEQRLKEYSQQAEREKELAVKENSIEHLQRQINIIMEQIDADEIKLEQMRSKKEELDKKQFIITNVIDFLNRAQENVSSRYVEPMQKKFSNIIEEISGDKSVKLDVDLTPSIDTQVGMREKQYLSRGKQDLVEICKRFALIQSVFEKEKPFIILDDPFINLDEKLLKNTLTLINKFAERFQIIYLICHKSRK